MQNDVNASVAALRKIHEVEGFDPASLAVEYTDLNSQGVRKRLPVQVQMGWFRLKYPEGKIAVNVQSGKDYFVAHARVYASYNAPPENYLAEATATRGKDPAKPTVSPREWAQTAAIGIALRNAGFGLSFDAAGDAFDHLAVDEAADIQFTIGNAAAQAQAAPLDTGAVWSGAATAVAFPGQPAQIQTTESQQSAVPAPPAANDPIQPASQAVGTLEAALQLPCPIKQHAGKTLGEVLQIDPDCISWIANKYKNDPQIADGARIICEHALNQASA